ncbi:hypothetical protein TNCV_153961 [Trichonephila clavipes]|nr:hypothetical protein TNCV_153961 [Trichonephila clavipes]
MNWVCRSEQEQLVLGTTRVPSNVVQHDKFRKVYVHVEEAVVSTDACHNPVYLPFDHSRTFLQGVPLTAQQRVGCLAWGHRHRTWTMKRHQVLLTDQSRFYLRRNDARRWLERRPGKRYEPTHFAKRQIGPYIGHHGLGKLARYESHRTLVDLCHIGRDMNRRPQAQTVSVLRTTVDVAWQRLPQATIHGIIDRMPCRIEACIAARSGHI